MRNHYLVISVTVMGLIALGAVAAPWLAPYDPFSMDAQRLLQRPSLEHWLGTDRFGRDIFSRLLFGARLSLGVAGGAVALAMAIGTCLGLAAGYFRGLCDSTISRWMDLMFAFPDILLALILVAVFGPTLFNITVAIGLVYSPIFARVVRSSSLSLSRQEYVEAARALGFPHFRILWRHVLPNLLNTLFVQVLLSLAFAILAESALSYLGLGVEPDSPSWGTMLSQGKDWAEQAWWVSVFPGFAITITVLALNGLGTGLRQWLDPQAAKPRYL